MRRKLLGSHDAVAEALPAREEGPRLGEAGEDDAPDVDVEDDVPDMETQPLLHLEEI